MKWVSYTRSISSRIGEENPSNTIAEQNERIARYLKKLGCNVSEKYSDRKRTAEATEGFDKLVQDLSMVSCRSEYKRNCPQVGIFRSSKAERTAESQIT